MKKLVLNILAITLVLLLSGCSFFGWNKNKDKEVDYSYVSELTTPTPTIAPFNPGPSTTTPKTNELQPPKEQETNFNPAKETMSITVYYQDEEGYIIPTVRTVEKQVGVARASINATINNSVNREDIAYYSLYPVLPSGTEILGINIKDRTAIIDFSPDVLDYSSEKEERNIISAIVYSLTEFDTIDNVRILVNGYELDELKYGTDVSGLLDRNNCMINSHRVNLEQGLQKSDIYLYKSVGNRFNYLVPVSIEHTVIAKTDIPGKLVDLLSNEYSNDKFFSELPAATKLLSSSVNDDVIELDFNRELRNYSGSARESRIVSQIYHTMKQIEGVNKIKILIEGKADKLPEGTNISQTVFLPKEINKINK